MGIEPYAERLIRIKAHQLVTRGGFSRSERKDIEQELKLDLLRRLPDFDPDRGSLEGFVCGVVEHQIARMLDRRAAAKRDRSRVEFSLNETIPDGQEGVVERADTMPNGQLPTEEQRDLAVDLADALSDLAPDLRRLCRHLREHNVTEIARLEGVSRKTIYERIKTVRQELRERGLDAYL